MTRAQIRERLGISMIENPRIANREMTEDEAKEYESMTLAILENFRKTAEEKQKNGARLLTMETFSEENRDRRIGHSLYRICRTRRKPYRWYIHEGYNDIENGHWARSNGFFTESLQEAIDKINSFTKEKQVIDRDLEIGI